MSNKAELLVINPTNGVVSRQIQCPTQVVCLHVSPSHVLSGSSDGLLRTHDLRAPTKRNSTSEHIVKAHQGSVQAIESSGNWIYSIGWSSLNGRPIPDPVVKIFDSRNLKLASSFNFAAGPSFLNVHPVKSTTLVLTSNSGVVNIVDVLNPSLGEFHQLDVASYLTSSAISPNAGYISFGDAEGIIHVLTASENDAEPFNGFEGRPVEWADEPAEPPEITWTDETPLNLIGMPYYSDYLLSSYDKGFQSVPEYYPPPMKIPPQVLASLRQVEGVSFAQLPRELQGKRNVISIPPPKKQGRFRSEKSRRAGGSPPPESPYDVQSGDSAPRHYQRNEIEYSKFGVEDFDFAFYNKTSFSGLETHILNSYTNALIQAMHYVLPIRQIAKSHITTSCSREYCLLCELGFVMRMLEDAKGINCQATNFCKTIPNIHSAATYDVIDYGRETHTVNYGAKIQFFNRFIVENIKVEGNIEPSNPSLAPFRQGIFQDKTPSPLSQLLSIESKSVITCTYCRNSNEKPDSSHIIDLTYPRKIPTNEASQYSDFASILRNSLIRDYSQKATCQSCKQVAVQNIRRSLTPELLPPILLLNTSIHNDEQLKLWQDSKNGRFLQPFVGVDIATSPSQLGGLSSTLVDVSAGLVWYELRSMVIDVKGSDQSSHLVCIAKVPEVERNRAEKYSWYLFNDFTVRGISEEDALSFPGRWKVPAVLYYERVDMQDGLDFSGLPMTQDPSILSQDISLSVVRDPSRKVHELLQLDELPKPGTIVAIDAEFVQMQLEETEVFGDGTRRILRPARLGLARVSVLRGSGPKEGVPFIDDYIHTSEEIVNYLSEFSGIHYGDLSPQMSAHTLVPLKVAYKKLRLLIDLGCIFVGHGLAKDFRIINIFVPPEQVIDTVDVYFIPERQRRISLRFLTWFVLEQEIQQDEHDSIEDARSALLLYKAFQAMEEAHTFDDKLEEIYRAGRENNWKPPSAAKASPPPMHATPGVPYSTFFPRPFSPTFPVDALANHFQGFTLDPPFRQQFVPVAPEVAAFSMPYTPPRTPSHHHSGRRSQGQRPR
ncbi:related to PAN2-component of Pab1p-stimulated poly(A) ribonuclease [Serendipita indica DSM 11827]|uniref:Related to PAN2-component of Pab1p-stimulated poly(A) ribonuclease n=1 Tax=Serendipita indica (strain DSM 11827) TaxID=1109443 RepID=G4T6I0_SERID|nr:related to PAN2-component of Pab1p-stimulated poly(A) ribonuclease [Serendipita indica DSM 11827]